MRDGRGKQREPVADTVRVGDVGTRTYSERIIATQEEALTLRARWEAALGWKPGPSQGQKEMKRV